MDATKPSRPAHWPFSSSLSVAGAASVLAFLVLSLCACRSPQKRVDQRLHSLQGEWQTNVQYQSNLPAEQIDWSAALAQLNAHNLKLRQARVEVTNSQEAVRQIFRDLTPALNLRSGISKKLDDFSATTFDDVTFSADSFFNIPGLLSFNARLYVTRLFQIRAETAAALTEREQTIELYKVFLQAQEIQADAAHLQAQRTTASAIREVDAFTGQLMLTEVELREINAKREAEALQQRAATLLGSHNARWIFKTNGLPDLRYDQDPILLSDTNRVAHLQLKLLAIELEAARAQLTGIKLRYWPELNLFISGPPVYQRSFGTERFFDAGEIRASADLFWYLDTRGHISRQLRQTKRQQALQRERMSAETIALIDRLILTQSLIQATREKVEQIDRNIEILRSVPPAQNFFALQKYADDYRNLADQQRQLRRELAELNTLFWFVDEYAWSPPGRLHAAAPAPHPTAQP